MRYDHRQEEVVGMTTQAIADYQRIERAILFLEKNALRQPDLKEVAQSVNLSEYHFQRLFKRWAGVSPKRFLQALTLERAKEALKNAGNLPAATYDSGLSSPGRLHDLFVKIEAVTPDEFRKKGAGLMIRYGFHPSPFGEALIAVTNRGMSNLAFISRGERGRKIRELKKQWKHAEIVEDASATKPYADRIFGGATAKTPMTLHLKGTNFQRKVWQALLKIPCGAVASYENIACMIGMPRSVRAVANAVAHNPVGYLIPCHRVIRKTGAIGGYGWGVPRKKAMLAWEAAKKDRAAKGRAAVF